MTTVSADRLAQVFVEVADTLVGEFDLIEFLHLVTDRAVGLTRASAAGLLLADQRGNLEFVAGSDENVRLLELFQIQNQEGPCLDAFRTGQPVINADLQIAGGRWPRFARQAAALEFRSVHAFPLRLRTEVIGALNLFGAAEGAFDQADVRIVQAVADVATIGLLQERTIRRGEVLTEQLQSALNSRIVIEQAKGAIAQTHGISVDEAFTTLREYARATRRRLSEVAQTVVTHPESIPDLSARRPESPS